MDINLKLKIMGYQLFSHISYTTYVIQLIISCIQLFYYLLATFHIMQCQQVLLKICTNLSAHNILQLWTQARLTGLCNFIGCILS